MPYFIPNRSQTLNNNIERQPEQLSQDYSNEPIEETIKRNVGRFAAVTGKTLGDVPYHIAQSGLNAASNAHNALNPFSAERYQGYPENIQKILQQPGGLPGSFGQQHEPYQLPEQLKIGSEIFKEAEQKLPSGYLQPQELSNNPYEAVQDKVAENFADLISPLGNKVKIYRAFAGAVGGEVAHWLGEKITGSEKVGDVLKTGMMIATALFDKKQLRAYEQAERNKWKSKIDRKIQTKGARELFEEEMRAVHKRGPSKENEEQLKWLRHTADTLGYETTNAKNLDGVKLEINEQIGKLGYKDEGLKRRYSSIVGLIKKVLKKGLGKDFEHLEISDGIHGGIARAEEARSEIGHIKQTFPLTAALFGYHFPKSAALVTAAGLAYPPAYELFKQLGEPQIRKYYTDLAKLAVAKQIPAQTRRNEMKKKAAKLESILEKNQEKKGRYFIPA